MVMKPTLSKKYLTQILTLGSSLPSSGPTVDLQFPTGRARLASDWLGQEGGAAAASYCDWPSIICFVRWALEASWACTPSTFL